MLYPVLWLSLVAILAVFGDSLAPYDVGARHFSADGALLRAETPSLAHPLGTTYGGFDVLSRVIVGARIALSAGLLGAGIIILLGTSIGVTAGYVGGQVDNILMRFTDVAYAVPLIPFAIVFIAFFPTGYYVSVLIIGTILWRSYARMLRSQVLQIKERPYIQAQKATGASTPRIIYKHILPNIGPMITLFFAMSVGTAILVLAALAFIGVTNPFVPSWGIMLRNAYQSGFMADQLGWSITPGLMIAFTVLSTFLLGRSIEERDEATIEG